MEILKYLEGKGHEVKDFGTHTAASCDYPVYGVAVAEAVVFRATLKRVLSSVEQVKV